MQVEPIIKQYYTFTIKQYYLNTTFLSVLSACGRSYTAEIFIRL